VDRAVFRDCRDPDRRCLDLDFLIDPDKSVVEGYV